MRARLVKLGNGRQAWSEMKTWVRDLLGAYRSGHHDFSVRAGAPVVADSIVGRSNHERWSLMAPVFRDAVAGRRVLDVGAHLGFFSLKALEHGAQHVTSLEMNPVLCGRMERVKARHGRSLRAREGDRWTIRCGDFFDPLPAYDTVMLFGITYHLLRTGMRRQVLPQVGAYRELFRRIAGIAQSRVIAEWGPPKRRSFEPSPYWDQFSYDAFRAALEECFPRAAYLGHHEYYGTGREDTRRHVHYGVKTAAA